MNPRSLPSAVPLLLLPLLLLLTLVQAATQVSLISYTFTSGTLAGSIKVQNLAFAKTVSVVYAIGSTWSSTSAQTLAAAYSSGPASDGYEVWAFSGAAAGATQFYVRYDVAGGTYYDPGNNVNYQIAATPTPISSSTSSTPCTVTATVTMTRA